MAEIEHRGDTLRAELVAKLATTLDVPLGREDLFRLSRSIDDVLDNLRDFAREWDLYRIAATDVFLGLLDAAASGVGDLHVAVQAMASDPRGTGQCALAAKKSADEIRRLYDLELGRLFRGELPWMFSSHASCCGASMWWDCDSTRPPTCSPTRP